MSESSMGSNYPQSSQPVAYATSVCPFSLSLASSEGAFSEGAFGGLASIGFIPISPIAVGDIGVGLPGPDSSASENEPTRTRVLLRLVDGTNVGDAGIGTSKPPDCMLARRPRAKFGLSKSMLGTTGTDGGAGRARCWPFRIVSPLRNLLSKLSNASAFSADTSCAFSRVARSSSAACLRLSAAIRSSSYVRLSFLHF